MWVGGPIAWASVPLLVLTQSLSIIKRRIVVARKFNEFALTMCGFMYNYENISVVSQFYDKDQNPIEYDVFESLDIGVKNVVNLGGA